MRLRKGERTYSFVRVGTRERVSMLRIRKKIIFWQERKYRERVCTYQV